MQINEMFTSATKKKNGIFSNKLYPAEEMNIEQTWRNHNVGTNSKMQFAILNNWPHSVFQIARYKRQLPEWRWMAQRKRAKQLKWMGMVCIW